MRWFTVHTERDRWSGPDVLLIEEWDTEQEAKKSEAKCNAENTETIAPDYYIVANVSNDLNLTLHKKYKDCRKK